MKCEGCSKDATIKGKFVVGSINNDLFSLCKSCSMKLFGMFFDENGDSIYPFIEQSKSKFQKRMDLLSDEDGSSNKHISESKDGEADDGTVGHEEHQDEDILGASFQAGIKDTVGLLEDEVRDREDIIKKMDRAARKVKKEKKNEIDVDKQIAMWQVGTSNPVEEHL